ncbi:hypothetical protein H0H93_014045 [Arthromyces matolae]|nr:hypothetical protein H0H93_014045 [Arthromyces matolae]
MNPGSPGPSSSKIPKFLRTSSSNSRPKSVEKSKVSRRSITMDPEETPIVIVEPIPRSPPSPTRISDLPSRLSGWFSHTFSSSTTDLSLPNILASSTSTSPKRNPGANALLTAAKHGKGHLDKAMRYILDSDAAPDKCTDPIWILGVKHPGYDPPSSLSSSTRSLRSSVSSNSDLTIQAQASKNPQWPVEFYADFTSRVWLTYRSHFPPIRDIRLADLESDPTTDFWKKSSRDDDNFIAPSPSVSRRSWAWGGEKGWTSDSGWGCMLRTGQSLLANALIHHHLGRDWRRPPHPIHTADYAKYVEIVSWFLDTPAPEAPFSVHRMALAGKELGTDVGQWFGPSTAAGAIKTLVNSFPTSDLGVAVATDGVLFQTEVFSASHLDSSRSVRSPRRHQKTLAKTITEL